jgi:hypothetical protein
MFKLLAIDFSPFRPNSGVELSPSHCYVKGSVLHHQDDKNPRTFFKCPVSEDKPHRLDIPSLDSVINLRLKRHAVPTSVDIGFIRVPVRATLNGRGELRLPMFCSKDFPRTIDGAHKMPGAVMCIVTVSFEHSFAAAAGPAYDNEALPWQLKALESLSLPEQRVAAAHSFADDFCNMLLPVFPSDKDFLVSLNFNHKRTKNPVFYDQPKTQSLIGASQEYSMHAPLFIEFLRCRDLPKMDTFGTCDCFITCGEWSTECVKNTQYVPSAQGQPHCLPSFC